MAELDLAEMQSMQKFNDGFCYLLVRIDIFSKYAYVFSLNYVENWSILRLSMLLTLHCPRRLPLKKVQ